MIEVSERTTSGFSAASIWPIIPPIEAPTTCAGATSRFRNRTAVSSAISESVYCSGERRRRTIWLIVGGTEIEVGRAADVAVVEADDIEAALGELVAEVLVPGDHLRRQSHDQHDRRVVGIAQGLVAEGHAPAHVAELLGHRAILDEPLFPLD